MRTSATAIGLGLGLAAISLYACVESSSTQRGPGQQSAAAQTGGPGPTTSSGGGAFDKAAMLANLGQQVLGTYEAFAVAADGLAAATESYASTLSAADRDAARDAWRDAMAVWQRAEVMQLGPAAAKSAATGGEDRRDEIYSWPLVNRCRVDQELVEGTYATAETLDAELINVRGLDALEYLLFYTGGTNACSAQASINSSGSWAALAGELEQRRADYASTAAELVAQEAASLRDRWAASGGNFLAEVQAPSSTYATQQEALNAFSDAMFYLDARTKDLKLAVPAGLSECESDVCPEALESTYAALAKLEVVKNLEGFQILYLGAAPDEDNPLGFEDLLLALGQTELAERMTADIAAAIAAAAAIEEDDLADALAADPESVRDLYDAVKKVTDSLKSDFLTVLDLNRPLAAEGDND